MTIAAKTIKNDEITCETTPSTQNEYCTDFSSLPETNRGYPIKQQKRRDDMYVKLLKAHKTYTVRLFQVCQKQTGGVQAQRILLACMSHLLYLAMYFVRCFVSRIVSETFVLAGYCRVVAICFATPPPESHHSAFQLLHLYHLTFSFQVKSLDSAIIWINRGHKCRPFSPSLRGFVFSAHRVQQSHSSSIFIGYC